MFPFTRWLYSTRAILLGNVSHFSTENIQMDVIAGVFMDCGLIFASLYWNNTIDDLRAPCVTIMVSVTIRQYRIDFYTFYYWTASCVACHLN